MPSDVTHSQQGLGERLKDQAVSAVSVVKDKLHPTASLEGQKLAGLHGANDALVQDNVLAKKEVNAEIEALASDNIHSDNIHPSTIVPAVAPGGVTVIHDGRANEEHVGSDRLKSELEYEQATKATEGHHMPSLAAMIKGTVVGVANVALAAAGAVKDQIQAATTREVSDKDFPAEFQKEDFEKELGVGAVKESDMEDDITKDAILAKKDVNAEIKEHAPTVGNTLHPSDITHNLENDAAQPSMAGMLKEKVANAAFAVKETLQKNLPEKR